MFGVEGQYVMSLNLGSARDIANDSTIGSLSMIQKSGGELPTLIVSFSTDQLEVLQNVYQGAILTLQIGRTRDEMIDCNWEVKFPSKTYMSQNSYNILLKCVLAVPKYTTHWRAACYVNQTSEQAIAAAASNSGLEIEADTYANDTMTWFQPTCTDFKFIQDTYIRYYGRGDSCAALAVTYDNKLRYYDLRKRADTKRSSPDWKLVIEGGGSNEIVIQQQIGFSQGDGFLNQWAGYGETVTYHKVNDGTQTSSNFTKDTDPIFQTSGADYKVNRENSAQPRLSLSRKLDTDNVHSNWILSKERNLSDLALCSSNKATCYYLHQFWDVKPLDIVTLQLPQIQSDESGGLVNTMESGQYIVQIVSLLYEKQKLSTTLEVVRDSVADVVGEIS